MKRALLILGIVAGALALAALLSTWEPLLGLLAVLGLRRPSHEQVPIPLPPDPEPAPVVVAPEQVEAEERIEEPTTPSREDLEDLDDLLDRLERRNQEHPL